MVQAQEWIQLGEFCEQIAPRKGAESKAKLVKRDRRTILQ
jgi:hypothetical protein